MDKRDFTILSSDRSFTTYSPWRRRRSSIVPRDENEWICWANFETRLAYSSICSHKYIFTSQPDSPTDNCSSPGTDAGSPQPTAAAISSATSAAAATSTRAGTKTDSSFETGRADESHGNNGWNGMPTILIIHLIQICCQKPKRHSASDNKHSKWQTILSILFKHSKTTKFKQKHKHRVRDNNKFY